MFRRSFRRSPQRRVPRRRSFGPRLRVPREPFRWEVCNVVFSTQTVVDDEETVFTSVVAMGQIHDHFGDETTGQGRALNEAMRFLEIGGIVFSYNLNLVQAGTVQDASSGAWSDNLFDHRVLIVSDRLDQIGSPTAIPNWFVPQTPLVGVSTTIPIGDTFDTEYPTRIHWQDRKQLAPSSALVNGQSTPVTPVLQTVSNAGGRANLRLRLRLQDDQGLFFHFATRISDPVALTQQYIWKCDVIGTMYYRFRF